MSSHPDLGVALSCAFPPGPDTPALIELAEQLGYFRAWCYDSPALYGDVWSTLCLAAARTERIGLGPAVLVPSLRHPMVTAAAIATLERLAPGRCSVAIGAGFTGRRVLGQGPMRWSDVTTYIDAVQALLRGDRADWEGATMQMVHDRGLVAARPIAVPFLLGADGPKGVSLARSRGLGLMSATVPHTGLSWCALLRVGTVLDPGEAYDAPRVIDTVGFGAAAEYHILYETNPEQLEALPGGPEWRAVIDSLPEDERHRNTGHMTRLTDTDRPVVTGEGIRRNTLTGPPERVRANIIRLRDRGLDEIVVQPGSRDVERGLRAFADVAASVTSQGRRSSHDH
ncbi:MAG: 5,10-methylenetetrahydromethanopterin reductase [Mycobacterium sp.]|jgi:5,10-methylenetetrahydromethanopterin reductase|nr:5,10-methylenetetrahydromethanopterin reductase [Mycobacterium sp.]MDT5170267.1 5,10-methylenetetrahydromethanopterin reductase [Mycobacterium sp.]